MSKEGENFLAKKEDSSSNPEMGALVDKAITSKQLTEEEKRILNLALEKDVEELKRKQRSAIGKGLPTREDELEQTRDVILNELKNEDIDNLSPESLQFALKAEIEELEQRIREKYTGNAAFFKRKLSKAFRQEEQDALNDLAVAKSSLEVLAVKNKNPFVLASGMELTPVSFIERINKEAKVLRELRDQLEERLDTDYQKMELRHYLNDDKVADRVAKKQVGKEWLIDRDKNHAFIRANFGFPPRSGKKPGFLYRIASPEYYKNTLQEISYQDGLFSLDDYFEVLQMELDFINDRIAQIPTITEQYLSGEIPEDLSTLPDDWLQSLVEGEKELDKIDEKTGLLNRKVFIERQILKDVKNKYFAKKVSEFIDNNTTMVEDVIDLTVKEELRRRVFPPRETFVLNLIERTRSSICDNFYEELRIKPSIQSYYFGERLTAEIDSKLRVFIEDKMGEKDPHSQETLEQARKLGEKLILRVGVDGSGQPMTIARMKILAKIPYVSAELEALKNVSPKLEWKLVGTSFVPNSTDKDYIHQTRALRQHLKYLRALSPDEESECSDYELERLAKFAGWKIDLRGMGEEKGLNKHEYALKGRELAKSLANLKINVNHRRNPAEIFYDSILEFKKNNDIGLLKNKWEISNTPLTQNGETRFFSLGNNQEKVDFSVLGVGIDLMIGGSKDHGVVSVR